MNKTGAIICLILFFLCGFGSSGPSAGEGWIEMKSRYFFVYYKNTPVDFSKTVINTAEEYYDDITHDLGFYSDKGWRFKDRAKIYIYDDQQDYVENGRQVQWSGGAAYYNRRMMKTYPSAVGFFDSTLPHELGHIIFHEFVGERVKIPTWFDEGVAMYQEKGKRWGAHQTVKVAIAEGTFIPLQDLAHVRLKHNSPREEIELFYAESASAVYFLIEEQGRFRFLNFCRRLQHGDKFYYAFELSYPHFKTLERFNKAWVSYLERQ